MERQYSMVNLPFVSAICEILFFALMVDDISVPRQTEEDIF